MNKLIKKICVGCMLFGLMTTIASAADEYNADGNKIKYDYGNNKIGITQDTDKEKQQLTVLLVKGTDTENITSDNIYYVNQLEGTSFATAFASLGVKDGQLPAGTYTLIAGGENVENGFKETVVIGDATTNKVPESIKNADFYTNRDTAVVNYGENKNAYATISDFGSFDSDGSGWLLQYIGADGKIYQLVKYARDLSAAATSENVNNVLATVSVGIQINGIPNDQKDFVAIPFTISGNATSAE